MVPAEIVVLGVAQDGGYPQAGCRGDCCATAWQDSDRRRMVACLGIVDAKSQQQWLIDCTPDFPKQLHELDGIDGMFLTHAHIGHYTGLIHLGREAMDTSRLPVYAMPRMRAFLESNAPWNQLVEAGKIELCGLSDRQRFELSERLNVTPLLVPHRGEFSETVGYCIRGTDRSALFLPDIDGWESWTRQIEELLDDVDVAYLDGTFFDSEELSGRDLSTIPHPTITDSIRQFSRLSDSVRGKIRFLHFNHTNPVLNPQSAAARAVAAAGHHLAVEGERFTL